jgi:hypothetical protein
MDKKLLTISSLLIITFLVFTGYLLFNGPISNFTRAANQGGSVSPSNSLVFAWPLTIAADGRSTSSVTVFLRDGEGRGIAQQRVTISTTIGSIDSETKVTDPDGKVVFEIFSTTPGVANLEFFIDNRKLEKSITVQFK